MLTDRGWAVLGAGVALLVTWVLLGEIELLAAGSLLLALVAGSAAFVVSARPTLDVVRHLFPTSVNEGGRVTVETIATNRGRRTLRNVVLVDEVERLGRAEFALGKMPADARAQMAYQIVCRPRGVYQVGPSSTEVADPLGLARTGRRLDRVDRLVVYPEVETLEGFPGSRGRDITTAASRPEFSHRGGEDFFTLREYRHGDDLRYVHWPSSAKLDELVIKQFETPWQSRALVLLDVRAGTYENDECFEKAVKGAASVIRHLARSGFDSELWTGGAAPLELTTLLAGMELLAEVQKVPHLDIRRAAARLSRVGRGGTLVIVTGVVDQPLLDAHRSFEHDYTTTIVLAATEATSAHEVAFHRAGAVTVNVSPSQSWSEAWSRAMDRTWSSA